MNGNLKPLTVDEIQSAFAGSITPARLSFFYRIGLAVVAAAMILLPLCYVGLIAVWGWLIKWHLTQNVWLLSGRGGRMFRAIAYAGPAIAGGIMFFFLVKPFFARAARREDPVTLDSSNEPVLFTFIHRICDEVRAPRPVRVAVDCQVNASASFDGGFLGLLRRRLVLTIGLPLAGGLTARQLGGVLAHEFGHFAQGAGMGLTFIIRSVNGWFARVVYERDEWDERLSRWSTNTDWRLAIVLWLARAGVWTSRKILYGLMIAGHAVSCFMSRQMEFDADYYEAALAGSGTFRETMTRLDLLSRASQYGYGDVFRSQRSGRVPGDFPALVVARAEPLRADADGAHGPEAPQRTLFMTHPSDEDRIAHTARLAAHGVVTLEGSASRLFADFGTLSRGVTRHHYRTDLGLDVDRLQLLDSSALLSEAMAAEAGDRALHRFFEGVLLGSRALAPRASATVGTGEAIARLATLRQELAGEMLRAGEAAADYKEAGERLMNAAGALALLQAGLKINGPEFDLEEGTPEHARAAIAGAEDVQRRSVPVLELVERLQAERLAIAASLAERPYPSSASVLPGRQKDVQSLTSAVTSIAAAWADVADARRHFLIWKLFLTNREVGGESADFAAQERLVADALRRSLKQLDERLQDESYPFAHAQAGCSIAAYLRGDDPEPDAGSDEGLYAAAHGRVDRALALYYSALGQLAAVALEIEDVVLPEQSAVA